MIRQFKPEQFGENMYKVIAFDFDGTLADSVDFCLNVFEKVFEKYLKDKAPTRESIYQNFGMNEPGVIKFYMGKMVPEADEYFYQLHKEMHAASCPETFPGTRELLEFLQKNNIKLALLTGRSETTCKISMDFLRLGHFFESFQTGSPERNDKTAQLLALVEKYGLQKH